MFQQAKSQLEDLTEGFREFSGSLNKATIIAVCIATVALLVAAMSYHKAASCG